MSKLTIALRYYAVLSATFLFLVLALPADSIARQNFHLTAAGYHILMFVVLLPIIGIWLAAFYSYARLEQYSQSIKQTDDGSDYFTLSRGFRWLAWGSALSSIVSITLNAIGNVKPPFHPAAIIIVNYASLLVPLVGFSIIGNAVRNLNSRAHITISRESTKTLVLAFLTLGVAYCLVMFRHINLHSMSASDNPYFLPGWLLVFTIIIPFLYAWFVGFLAAFEMYLYSKHVKGVLYQRAIRLLSVGTSAVITSSIANQYLRSATPRTGSLSLNATLLLVYLIFILMAVGYVLVSQAARQLRKIEEV
ncbi:MAG: hypothetical protein ABIV43_00460 [Candidatus Saccharimonadales bacterium]